jgi:hypothetical protein
MSIWNSRPDAPPPSSLPYKGSLADMAHEIENLTITVAQLKERIGKMELREVQVNTGVLRQATLDEIRDGNGWSLPRMVYVPLDILAQEVMRRLGIKWEHETKVPGHFVDVPKAKR